LKKREIILLVLFIFVAFGWPTMRRDDPPIGPPCTAGVHNWIPDSAPCPPGINSNVGDDSVHKFADQFSMDFTMYFSPDANYNPPYDPIPTRNFTSTKGKTYYDMKYRGGAMRESYLEKCIPIFFSGPFSKNNNWKCDFINVADTNTAYFVTHDDRPVDAPPCCIIGRPFHPPHPTFSANMTSKSSSVIDGVPVDWTSLSLTDSGPFSFGFVANNTEEWSYPYAFYFLGVPFIAPWVYQTFSNFVHEKPSENVWKIPDFCENAKPCPGF